jgi:hypothetical protein
MEWGDEVVRIARITLGLVLMCTSGSISGARRGLRYTHLPTFEIPEITHSQDIDCRTMFLYFKRYYVQTICKKTI